MCLSFGALLLVAGCGNSNNPHLDGGPDGQAPGMEPGVGMEPATQALSCSAIISCTNNATTQAAFQACINKGTSNGRTLFNALDMCLRNTCGMANDDAGATQCDTLVQCVGCVQTGTSATNMMNGACNNGTANITTTPPPTQCGKCVDQLIACANDM
jgi:hypothetical protein